MLTLSCSAAGRLRPLAAHSRHSALHGSLRACLPAARPRCRATLAVRAYQADGQGEEVPAADRHAEFGALASQVVGLLASEFASNDQNGPYAKLEQWLMGSHDDQPELAPRTDQTTEESDAKRLIRQAAEHFGAPTTLHDAVSSVSHWLGNPSGAEEGADTQMVARLLGRLLETYEQHTGEDFEGQEHQYDQLFALAQRALGSSVPKSLLKSAVRAYLGI